MHSILLCLPTGSSRLAPTNLCFVLYSLSFLLLRQVFGRFPLTKTTQTYLRRLNITTSEGQHVPKASQTDVKSTSSQGRPRSFPPNLVPTSGFQPPGSFRSKPVEGTRGHVVHWWGEGVVMICQFPLLSSTPRAYYGRF